MIRQLTRTEARRIAIRAQLLTAARPVDLLATAQQLTMIQLDPIAVVAPSADLVGWSRLGNCYQPEHLRRALDVDRTLFEHRDLEDPSSGNIALVRPMSSIGWYLAQMYALRDTPGVVHDWLEANAGFRARVVDQLRSEGPILSKAIPDTADVPWKSTGWTNGKNVTQLLEFLASRGVVAIAGRVGRQRVWDVAERVYPQDVDIVPIDEALARRNEARLRALGLARQKFVGDAGIPAEVEGVARTWRLDPAATADDFDGRTALLSPFDRLIHARDRSLDLFDFEFGIELYKPKAKRRWGYYALPVLHHDRLVAKIDLSVDRDRSTLVVEQTTHDVEWTRAIRLGVDDELSALAKWLQLDAVAV